MDHLAATYGVILNDRRLRESAIREAAGSRRPRPVTRGSYYLRMWFAHVLHSLAARVDPMAQGLELRPAP
jgi:hypothetical protein